MKAAAALSMHPIASQAVGETAGSILEELEGTAIDLLVVFMDSAHTGAVEDISSALGQLLNPRVLLGTTACGVIGQINEVEDSPSLSIWAGTDMAATPLRIEPGDSAPIGGWASLAGSSSTNEQNVILLADPFSTPLDELVADAHSSAPNLRIHGGLSSAARGPGGNRLLLDGAIYTNGAVGVDLGSTPTVSVVSQGCRPLGNAFTVTGAQGNVITELASQQPLDVLEAVATNASEADRQLLAQGIHIGVVFDEGQLDEFDRGDFLIRPVLGADPESGAIAIGAAIEPGTTVQFQVRDAASASEDLTGMLSDANDVDATAALTFTCNGRGLHLFGRSGHDAELVHGITGSRATAGMFCAGEFGPVRSENHIHGFTASTLLFR